MKKFEPLKGFPLVDTNQIEENCSSGCQLNIDKKATSLYLNQLHILIGILKDQY
jgi:hypothetical protein